MKRPRIRALFPPFVLLLTALELHAAVNITSPAVPDPFPAVPAATDWSTASVAGTSPADAAALDAAVIANTTSAGVADALGSSPANPPSSTATARYNTTLSLLQTRPLGNAYTLLMATLVNATGGELYSIHLNYDYSKGTDTASEVIKGHRVYFSTTGNRGEWTLIPELSVDTTGTPAAPQAISAFFDPAAPVANGATVYVVWADQNSSGFDASYHIDNFSASPGLSFEIRGSPTAPVRHPGADAVNPADDTVTFSTTVTANGVPGPGWVIASGPMTGTTGNYGDTVSFNLPIADFAAGPVTVRFQDQTTAEAYFQTTVTAPPFVHEAAGPIAPGELVAPKFEIVGGNLNLTVQPSVAGRSYLLQYSDTLNGGTWLDLGGSVIGDGSNLVMSTPYTAGVPRRFFRLALDAAAGVPTGFALIPAGAFQMGQTGLAEPVHTVQVSAFYMGKYEVTKEEWDAVRAWGLANGYTNPDLAVGSMSGTTNSSKGANHPVHWITWDDMVRWCNARSQKEGLTPCYTVSGATYKTWSQSNPVCNWNANGYRLPTEAEWEKAARGGVAGKNFPWGTDTITHSQANYNSSWDYAYDVSPTRDFHPTYEVGDRPYSSPVGSFAPNGYGLYDMAGNMSEWCWDWYDSYAAGSQTDPRGPGPRPSVDSHHVIRGGDWINNAYFCLVANRYDGWSYTWNLSDGLGFRVARSSVP